MQFLHRQGTQIVDEENRPVRLRGACIGGWMLMENFITGYPGTESELRGSLSTVLGPERGAFLVERVLDHFVTEDDLAYLAGLGLNVVRVALNYRHFENDAQPFVYCPGGFARLDRLIAGCRQHGLYVILDLHAVQGWQNPDWHSDNPTTAVLVYHHRDFQERLARLWQVLARRYAHEPAVAGYNLINEPETDDAAALRALYLRLTAAVREVDPRHLLFYDGNHYATSFSELGEPFDPQMVVASHNYVMHWGLGATGVAAKARPGALRKMIETSDGVVYSRKHGLPQWCGEFGAFYHEPDDARAFGGFFREECQIFNALGIHWTFWTYKDVGPMGLVHPAPDSAWMRRTAPVRKAKQLLGTDSWFDYRGTARQAEWKRAIKEGVQEALSGSGLKAVETRRFGKVLDGAVSSLLLQAFAEQFKGLSEAELDEAAASFRFDRCVRHPEFEQTLKETAKG